MKLHLQSIHCEVEASFLEHIRTKLYNLALNYGCIIETDVYLIEDPISSGRDKLVELLLRIPETDLFAQHRGFTFELAARDALHALKKQLEEYKEHELAFC